MENLIAAYIESKKLAWSESTIRSEGYRLKAISWEHLDNPTKQYEVLAERMKPYAMVTTFHRLSSFYEWLLRHGHKTGYNIYREFMEEHARLFKNAYQKKKVNVDYNETLTKISKIKRLESRAKAIFDLKAGLRVQADRIEGAEVIGKGGYRRPLFVSKSELPPPFKMSYSTYLSDLKSVGLSPHDLRKVFANKLLRSGLTLTDVMAAGGWRSLQSVEKYLQELETEQLRQRVSGVMSA